MLNAYDFQKKIKQRKIFILALVFDNLPLRFRSRFRFRCEHGFEAIDESSLLLVLALLPALHLEAVHLEHEVAGELRHLHGASCDSTRTNALPIHAQEGGGLVAGEALQREVLLVSIIDDVF